MNVNGLLTKRWLSHLESNQNSGYQKPVCSRYTMGQAELRILYHIGLGRSIKGDECAVFRLRPLRHTFDQHLALGLEFLKVLPLAVGLGVGHHALHLVNLVNQPVSLG